MVSRFEWRQWELQDRQIPPGGQPKYIFGVGCTWWLSRNGLGWEAI